MNKQKTLFGTILGILMIGVVSAYNGFDYGYYDSPWDLLGGEWATFGTIFIISWVIFYFAGRRTYETYEDRQNKFLLTILSAGLALLVSITITKRAMMYGFAGEGIGDILTIIFGVILILALFKVLFKWFGKFGLVVALAITTIIFTYTDFYMILPESMMYGPVGTFIYWIRGISWFGLGALILFGIAIVIKFIKGIFGGGSGASTGGGGAGRPARATALSIQKKSALPKGTKVRLIGPGKK